MTREEALEYNKNLRLYMKIEDKKSECKFLEENYIALDMAIKALESKDVLDKIRAEIIEKFGNCSVCEWFEDYDYEENDISEYRSVGDISDIIEIINKYKEESEDEA